MSSFDDGDITAVLLNTDIATLTNNQIDILLSRIKIALGGITGHDIHDPLIRIEQNFLTQWQSDLRALRPKVVRNSKQVA